MGTGDWGLGTQRPLSASLGIGDWGLTIKKKSPICRVRQERENLG
ncbi:MAG: hypothetical protein HEQ35_30800 [Gloeotrichia echinulata IR180]